MLNDFSEFLVVPGKGRKLQLVETVVGDVRCIIKATSFSILYNNDIETPNSQYLNFYCIEHKIEPGLIAKYLIFIIDLSKIFNILIFFFNFFYTDHKNKCR